MNSHTPRKSKLCFFAWLMVFVFSTPAQAQFWEKKDWRQWTKQECEKVLSDSPWSRTYTSTLPYTQPGGLGTSADAGTSAPEGERNPNIQYVAQLRSALPVRQAVVRLQQLQSKYDKMSEAEKKSFDEQANTYLEQDFSNRVVVHVNYSTNVQQLDRDLASIWQTEILKPEIRTYTYMVSPKGDQIAPKQFFRSQGGGRDFELIFSKEYKELPFAKPDNRGFQLQLPGVSFKDERILIQWDARKMTFQGKFEY